MLNNVIVNVLCDFGDDEKTSQLGEIIFAKLHATANTENQDNRVDICYNKFINGEPNFRMNFLYNLFSRIINSVPAEATKILNKYNNILTERNLYYKNLEEKITVSTNMTDTEKAALVKSLEDGRIEDDNKLYKQRLYSDSLNFCVNNITYDRVYKK